MGIPSAAMEGQERKQFWSDVLARWVVLIIGMWLIGVPLALMLTADLARTRVVGWVILVVGAFVIAAVRERRQRRRVDQVALHRSRIAAAHAVEHAADDQPSRGFAMMIGLSSMGCRQPPQFSMRSTLHPSKMGLQEVQALVCCFRRTRVRDYR
jgi:hypothetical protein